MKKPNLEDLVTAVSALRLSLVRDAGDLGAMAAAGHRDADALRRSGYHDFAVAAEQRAEQAAQLGFRLADTLERIARVLGEPSPPRQRTGEWHPPTPEETAATLAETVRNPVSDIAEANAREDE